MNSTYNFTAVRIAVQELGGMTHLYKSQVKDLVQCLMRFTVLKDLPPEILEASAKKAVEIVFGEQINAR